MRIIERRPAVIAGAAIVSAAILSAGAFGVQAAVAANDTSTTTQAPPPGGPGGPGMRLNDLLHGEDVVKDQAGAVQTIQIQGGTVTEVSETSITVKSSDDFVGTYVVNSDTKVGKDGKKAAIGDIKVGDTVHLGGKKADGKVTADHIMAGELKAPPRANGTGPQGQLGQNQSQGQQTN